MQFTDVLAALQNSQDRLAATVTPLTGDQVASQSYDDDWTIAQVASHLGSGAEIFGLIVDAGLKSSPAPGMEEFRPVWDQWNARPAPDQARDAVSANAAFHTHVAALAPGEREDWRLELFGAEQTLLSLLRMRLCEHAVHTWDIAVALDPGATVAGDAVALILGVLPGLAARAGKGASEPVSVHVATSDPEQEFLLELAPGKTTLTEVEGPVDAAATLRLPAEAFVRLVYGRLDPGHTPSSVETDAIELDTLRRAFPGF
jgi:uncharacterized protein (TIGR03083 family)